MTLQRTWLFVPAHEPRKVDKAAGLGSDVVILDLEDAVPPDQKGTARAAAALALAERGSRPAYYVRVNAVGSGYLEADLDAVVRLAPDGLVVPKVECADDVASVDSELQNIERRAGLEPGHIRLLATLETAKGIINAPQICGSCARLAGILFGAEDLALDIGLPLLRDDEPDDMLYARSAIVLAAAAEQLRAVDRVYPNLGSVDGLRRDTQRAIGLGFTGKAVIHPTQVRPVNELFCPRMEEVAYAERVLDTFECGLTEGRGAVSLDGRLIDAPIVARARQILRLHRLCGQGEEKTFP